MKIAKVQCVIFDWAGTMVDYGSRAPARVFQETFRQAGIDISIEQAREPMGMAKREHIAAIMAMDSVRAQWQSEYGRMPGEADIDQLYVDFQPLQLSVIQNYCDLIPGALQTFEWCRDQGIRVASSTGYTREIMQIVIPAAAAQGYDPEVVLCAEDAPTGRPAPWLIYESAQRFGIFPMSKVVKVDDTLVGIQAGCNAGCWTIGVVRTGNMLGLSEEEIAMLDPTELAQRMDVARQSFIEAGATFVVEGVADVPGIIEQINTELAGETQWTVVPASYHRANA